MSFFPSPEHPDLLTASEKRTYSRRSKLEVAAGFVGLFGTVVLCHSAFTTNIPETLVGGIMVISGYGTVTGIDAQLVRIDNESATRPQAYELPLEEDLNNNC